MEGLRGQIETFVLTMVLGIVTGSIFHFYQAVIRSARVSRCVLYILDFSLWIIIIVLVFLSMLFINQGEMRIYVLIALLLGIIIYYRRFARRFAAGVGRGARAVIAAGAALSGVSKKIFSRVARQLDRLKSPTQDPPPDPRD